MYHRLALGMGRTVGELKSTLTVGELASWMAYMQVCGPIDPVVAMDYYFAHLCCRMVEVNGGKKRGGGDFSVSDFLVFNKPVEEPKTALQAMREWFGSRIVKKPKE